jgi:3-isopropylmalate/(R)-2-methylmalate dehydratase large subunit
MAVELGSRFAIIAPDETTFAYLSGRPYAPSPGHWDAALEDWGTLVSDQDAAFDREVAFDVSDVAPQITWGTSPQDVIGIGERIPDPSGESDPQRRSQIEAALAYTGLPAGTAIEGVPVDFVFIGSCVNNRISDLRLAAGVAKGRKVAGNLVAWVIPGSQRVKAQAESEGLDAIFIVAGFNWGEPGCSMCGGQGNGFTEILRPGMRSVSTINRNFPNRQGPKSITHLASPPMAAAAAVSGRIVDVRKI